MENTEKTEREFRRLLWHSRRGMLELDVILLPFTENRYRDLSAEDQRDYHALINCEDQDLFNWFMEKAVCPDPSIRRMVSVVLEHARQG